MNALNALFGKQRSISVILVFWMTFYIIFSFVILLVLLTLRFIFHF